MASAEKIAAQFKLVFFVPRDNVSVCKKAIFAAGGGRSGNYTECCWVSYDCGVRQFCPGDGAKPHVGKVGKVKKVVECRVEILCVGEEVARKAVAALKR